MLNKDPKGGTAPFRHPVSDLTSSRGAKVSLLVPIIFLSFFQSSLLEADITASKKTGFSLSFLFTMNIALAPEASVTPRASADS